MLDKIIAAKSPEDFISRLVDQTKCECYNDITKVCIHCFAEVVHKEKIMRGPKRLEFYNLIRRMERQMLQRKRIIPPKEIKVYLRTIADKKLMARYAEMKKNRLMVA